MIRSYILKPLAWLVVVALVLLMAAGGVGLGYRSWKQWDVRTATRIETPGGIESLELATINNSKQWIYLRGHDRDNPVLLFLHGGPGTTELPVARAFGLEAEEHFTVVHWDQRAAGKSRRQEWSEEDLNVQTFVDDTVDLVNQLRERFQKDKIYLVGHSWGSMLGILAVRDHPELFHAYVGMGQLVNLADNERVALDWVRERAAEEGNTAALEELAGLNPPYTEDPQQLGIQRKWLYTYGGGMRGFSPIALLRDYLTSPEYSILDLIGLPGGMSVATHMWPEMATYDFRIDAPKLDIPIYFFAGRYDYNTPSILASDYLEMLEAPSKELIWFENSAHIMNYSDPDRYQDLLINKVLRETSE